ncbi:hypothetical protein NL676_028798 [Syzygium grande]|nr:hypothetical protein NL676_028798 [Syzygium grande]
MKIKSFSVHEAVAQPEPRESPTQKHEREIPELSNEANKDSRKQREPTERETERKSTTLSSSQRQKARTFGRADGGFQGNGVTSASRNAPRNGPIEGRRRRNRARFLRAQKSGEGHDASEGRRETGGGSAEGVSQHSRCSFARRKTKMKTKGGKRVL